MIQGPRGRKLGMPSVFNKNTAKSVNAKGSTRAMMRRNDNQTAQSMSEVELMAGERVARTSGNIYSTAQGGFAVHVPRIPIA